MALCFSRGQDRGLVLKTQAPCFYGDELCCYGFESTSAFLLLARKAAADWRVMHFTCALTQ